MSQDTDALLEEFTRYRAWRESQEGEEDFEEGTTAAPAPKENSAIKAIRAEQKRAEKRAAAAEAEAAELREFRDKTLASTKARELAAAGFTEAQANVFSKAYDEVTPEAVETFKRDVLGIREEAEEEGSVPAAPFAPAGFSSEKPTKPLEGAEAREFAKKHGMEAAAKAWEEGKLKL